MYRLFLRSGVRARMAISVPCPRGHTLLGLAPVRFFHSSTTDTGIQASTDIHSGEYQHSSLPSVDVRREEEDADFDSEGFDELEAASQEAHDLCYSMIAYLRKADPDATSALFERRIKKKFREPVPEHKRRLLHGHGDQAARRRNSFRNETEFKEATQVYLQLGEKLLVLLSKDLLDRLLESAGKGAKDMRSDGVHKYKNPIERATWRTFPHRWFKHAPFEVQQLRADVPESAVKNTRCYRDMATLRYIFSLMEPNHPYRAAIEQRMFHITQHYDPKCF